MTLHDLLEKLTEYEPELHEFSRLIDVRCLKLMSKGMEGRSSDLILCRTEECMRYGIPPGCKNLICVGDVGPLCPMLEEHEVNCLALKNCPDIYNLYNTISEEICVSAQLRQGTDILFNSVGVTKRKIDVDKIIDTVGDLFGNPVALFSTNGDVIAYRDLDSIYPELLNDFQFDHLAESFSNFLESCDLTHDQPQILSGFLGKENRAILSRVSFHGKAFAYCVVFEKNSFTDAEGPLLMLVCAWLVQEMRLGSIDLNPNNTFAYKFLSSLIEGQIMSDDTLKQCLHTMRLDKLPYYYVIVADLSSLDVRHGSPRSIGDMLQHKMRSGITTLYDNHLVVLLNSSQGFEKDAVSDFSLEPFLRSINASAGVSYFFTSLKDTPSAYRQACRAIELGRIFDSMGHIFFYSDCAVYDLITSSNLTGSSSMSFCMPQLMELLTHDTMYNTQYVYTLYTLIVSGGKQTVAAKALGIHRTTMQYRMEKITEKTGLDIYDTYNLVRLYLSFGILIQNGYLDPEVYYQL